MDPSALKQYIKVAKKSKIQVADLCRDIADHTPHRDLVKMFQEKLRIKEDKYYRLLEDMIRDRKPPGKRRKESSQDHKPSYTPPISEYLEADAELECLTIPLCQEVFISKRCHDENFSDYETLFVGRDEKPNNVFRTLLQFDLDRIPDNCTVIKADLIISLCSNELPGRGLPIYLHPILTRWSADRVTWDDRPEIAREYWRSFVPGGVLDEICIDVLDYIRDYSECPNHGIMLCGTESKDGFIGIEAKECGPRQNAPYIRITMECEEEE